MFASYTVESLCKQAIVSTSVTFKAMIDSDCFAFYLNSAFWLTLMGTKGHCCCAFRMNLPNISCQFNSDASIVTFKHLSLREVSVFVQLISAVSAHANYPGLPLVIPN